MNDKKIILQDKKFDLTLQRLAHQLIENYNDFENTCIIGIQENGGFFADRLYEIIKKEVKGLKAEFGKMDITFYRDDFRIRKSPLAASKNDIDFLVQGKKVILIDDVLYTGRTIQAAFSAMQHYGRPQKVELAVLIDRRFNRQFPIEADYRGLSVDALEEAYVEVKWKHIDGTDIVIFYPDRN
ncbi:MAG: bifunctional pyr operon transcriptional regulator/uracil phosphoribosyltransferase PyrR [Saprospiraceae bacterium]|nr:bifunctional pyr operon transcriptional regulator/uracil phosphoribosyltransferase PyrR [Saprospiraceae bacterium]